MIANELLHFLKLIEGLFTLPQIVKNTFHNDRVPVLHLVDHFVFVKVDHIEVQVLSLDTNVAIAIVEVVQTEGKDLLVVKEGHHVELAYLLVLDFGPKYYVINVHYLLSVLLKLV